MKENNNVYSSLAIFTASAKVKVGNWEKILTINGPILQLQQIFGNRRYGVS